MPIKPRRLVSHTNSVSKRVALNERIIALRREITRLRRERAAVSRAEFKEVVQSLHQIQRNTDDLQHHTKELRTQFARIAQMQTELDAITRALKKAKLFD